MASILFLVLWIIPVLQAHAQEAIEIYSNGHKYDSFQDYKASKIPAAVPASLNNQQEADVRQESQKLGIKVDFSKVKTFQINQKDLSDSTRHKLYVMSIEDGVVGALQDFYKTWGQPDFLMTRRIDTKQLQEAIQQAFTTSKGPRLLISTPGKVRIMTLK